MEEIHSCQTFEEPVVLGQVVNHAEMRSREALTALVVERGLGVIPMLLGSTWWEVSKTFEHDHR